MAFQLIEINRVFYDNLLARQEIAHTLSQAQQAGTTQGGHANRCEGGCVSFPKDKNQICLYLPKYA